VRFADGDQEILSPENFYFFRVHEGLRGVETRKVEDQEVILLVHVDLGTQVHHAAAVFDVQRVEMVVVRKDLQILFIGPDDVRPFEVAEFDRFNHGLPPVFG
jgi:hypothetical protein